jgi:predicted CopG family antitoxin
MAVKTITIDIAAYEALSRRKKPGQSFSDVIKLRFGAGRTGRDLLHALDRDVPARETIDATEKLLKSRKKSPARARRA